MTAKKLYPNMLNRFAPIKQKTRLLLEALLRFIATPTFFWLSIGWFVLQALYIAYTTRFGIPPDEVFHVSYIKMFANEGLSPFLNTQVGYFNLGEVARSPFMLYPYLLSIPYHLIDSSPHALFILRVLNILMATGSLLLIRRLARILKFSDIITNLSIFMMVNTLMFVFLSASVNYDNLFILLSLFSTLLLLLLLERFTTQRLLLLLATLLAGVLTKLSFAPIAVSIFLIFAWKSKFKLPEIKTAFGQTLKKNRAHSFFIALCVLFLFIIFCQRYVVNLVKYNSPIPSCTKVLTVEQCRQNIIFERDEKISASKRPTPNRDTVEFAVDWSLLMQDRTYGIFSHKQAQPTSVINVWSEIVIVVALLAYIRTYKKRSHAIVLAIAGFYTLVLFYTNFKTYQTSGSFGFAVQGRYLFPVLPLVYLFANEAILKWLHGSVIQITYVVITLCVFMTASLPSFIFRTTPDWHNQNTAGFNQQLKDLLINIRMLP